MDFFSTEAVLIFFLILVRNTGMMIAAPLFSTAPMPEQVKIALSVGLTIVMFPIVFKATPSVPADMLIFSLVACKELIIGVMIGFSATLIITSIQISGEYISSMMGLSIANIVDPVTQQNVPVIGQFYYLLALMMFIFIDGDHWLFGAVFTSFQAVPIGLDFPGMSETLGRILTMSSQMFVIALMLVLPIMGVLFVIEIAMGFMAKVMPQMNIFIVGLPLKIFVGLALMIMVMPMTKVFIAEIFRTLSYNLYGLFS